MKKLIKIIEMLEGESDEYRKNVICQKLHDLGINFTKQPYGGGENILVLGNKAKNIAIGSHFDCVDNCPGANDNASAVAVLLDVLEKLQKDPLNNIGVTACFFDEEETGLIGSRAYVSNYGVADLIGLYNLELVGNGKIAAIWPIEDAEEKHTLDILTQQASILKIPIFHFPKILTNSADHEPFRWARVKNAFTITMICKEDIVVAKEYLNAKRNLAKSDTLIEILSRSPIFKHYHMPTDTSKHLNEKTLSKVSTLLFNSIKELDRE